jgi:hypothetical protein
MDAPGCAYGAGFDHSQVTRRLGLLWGTHDALQEEGVEAVQELYGMRVAGDPDVGEQEAYIARLWGRTQALQRRLADRPVRLVAVRERLVRRYIRRLGAAARGEAPVWLARQVDATITAVTAALEVAIQERR